MDRINPKHTKVLLHIFTEFQGHSSEKKRVIKMNLWEELVESTTKAILHISTVFQEDLLEMNELLE